MDLIDLADSLRRAVAPLGEFETYFPEASDEDVEMMLADALAEAQLDGFLSQVSLDVSAATVAPDLTSPQQALVVLYGRARIITSRLANIKNRTRYKAGNVEAESETSASILVEILRDTQARKKQLLDDARQGNGVTNFSMSDMFVSKSLDVGWYNPGAQYAYQFQYDSGENSRF